MSKRDLLDRALTCFATQGLQATSIDDLTTALDVSNRTLYRELGHKAALVEAVYAYATAQLLGDYPAAPQAGETLQAYLGRWWQQTAAAAQADPRAFRYWQFYRTSPHRPAAELVLGPFAALPELLTPLVAQPGGRRAAEALPLPVLSRWWAAQWTAAVEVVLTDPHLPGPVGARPMRADAGLHQLVAEPGRGGHGVGRQKGRPANLLGLLLKRGRGPLYGNGRSDGDSGGPG